MTHRSWKQVILIKFFILPFSLSYFLVWHEEKTKLAVEFNIHHHFNLIYHLISCKSSVLMIIIDSHNKQIKFSAIPYAGSPNSKSKGLQTHVNVLSATYQIIAILMHFL